ncbi:hypothetical protein DFJ73DRAFT_62701 [Zopfochytrium polystomum]|nr:hypothetical protein DFJ73DRAFT_62701 [Zopfochytrium polystomum]
MGVVPGSSVVGTSDLRVVFVDPDDENTPWWWPALVVSPKEFQQFRQTVWCRGNVLDLIDILFLQMEIEIEEPKEGEYLVCYFEDGSFSVVPEAAAMPFCPTKPPYTTYLNGRNGAAFRADNAVRLATDFWTNGVAPPSFAWLHSLAKPETSASGQSGKKATVSVIPRCTCFREGKCFSSRCRCQKGSEKPGCSSSKKV